MEEYQVATEVPDISIIQQRYCKGKTTTTTATYPLMHIGANKYYKNLALLLANLATEVKKYSFAEVKLDIQHRALGRSWLSE